MTYEKDYVYMYGQIMSTYAYLDLAVLRILV